VFTAVTIERDTRASNIFDRARLPHSTKIDLTDVYRYTPEIGSLIRYVSNEAPALNLPELDIPEGRSVVASGPVPDLFVVGTKERVLRKAVGLAQEYLKDARKRRGRVAILGVDDSRFKDYLPAARNQYERVLFVIAARDDIEKLRFSRGRIVFSTPEYVAGQQFDTVILMDVNKDLVPEGKYKGLNLRRFLSTVYTGISRAEFRLSMVSARDAGGDSPHLQKAILDHKLTKYIE
jgi:hypothetical protein